MKPLKLGATCFVLCVGGALASVVVETHKWWDIDAQTSWTAVMLAGWLVSFGYGIALSRYRVGPKEVGGGAAIIMACVAVPLLVGFGIKAVGLPVPWRPPALIGGIPLSIVFSWLLFAALILLGLLAGKAGRAIWRGVRRLGLGPRQRPELSQP